MASKLTYRRLSGWLVLMALIAALAAVWRDGPSSHASSVSATGEGGQETGVEHVELAPYMTRMQVYSQKLGYSIRGQNQPLADFYMQEIKEAALEVISRIPVYEGVPVDQYLYVMLYPTFKPLTESIGAGDWAAADERYRHLINACNACHAAASYPFIEILPASGEPPFNQSFEPAADAGG